MPNRYLLLLLGLMTLIVVVVPPTGEFPCSDDWDYKATVDELVSKGRLRLSDYPAMTLVGHVAWGSLFVLAFGSSHFTLRASVLVAAAAGTIALFSMARRRGASDGAAAFLAFAFFASPLSLASEYTFLTDASAVGFMLIWLYLAARTGPATPVAGWAVLGLLGGFVHLFRQPAAVPVAVFAVFACIEVVQNRMPLRKALAFAVTVLAVVVVYQIWIRAFEGVPMNAARPLLPLPRGPVREFDHCCSMIGALALFALPATIAAFQAGSPNRRRKLLLSVAGLALLTVNAAPFVDFDGQTLEDLALGYDRVIPGRHLLVGPRLSVAGFEVGAVNLVKTILLVVALPSLLISLAGVLSHKFAEVRDGVLQRVLLPTLAVHGVLLAVAPDTFDRYLLPVLPILFLLVAPRFRPTSPAFALLLLATAVGVVGIQDYMVRNRALWRTLGEIEADGVPPSRILAGHAYAGIHRFTPIYRTDGGNRARSVRAASRSVLAQRLSPIDPSSPPHFIVGFAPVERYRVVREEPFTSWLRRGSIVVQEASPPNSGDAETNGK